MTRIIGGIDPGESGSIALLHMDGRPFHILEAGKLTLYDMADYLRGVHLAIQCIYIERVGVRPEQGISSAAKFMINFGEYKGLMAGLRIPIKYVVPQVWQRNLKCLTKGDKNVTKRKAQELFPMLEITHQKADAYLIAEYGRRQEHLINFNADSADDL
jgi:crossover junction endodeoxyribonuclease RuvC